MREALLPPKNSRGGGQVEAELLRAGAADHDSLLRDSPGRVESEADANSAPCALRDLLELLELPLPFGMDDRHSRPHERFDVRVGFRGAGRKNLRRWTSGAARREHLAFGCDVRRETEFSQKGKNPERRVCFDRVSKLEARTERAPKAHNLALAHVEVVQIQRRPIPRRCTKDRRVHRKALSSTVRASVFASRYFTIMGAESESPRASAQAPVARREPGTTTAPSGMTSGRSGVERSSFSFTRSKRTLDAVRITPAARTARFLTRTPS